MCVHVCVYHQACTSTSLRCSGSVRLYRLGNRPKEKCLKFNLYEEIPEDVQAWIFYSP